MLNTFAKPFETCFLCICFYNISLLSGKNRHNCPSQKCVSHGHCAHAVHVSPCACSHKKHNTGTCTYKHHSTAVLENLQPQTVVSDLSDT